MGFLCAAHFCVAVCGRATKAAHDKESTGQHGQTVVSQVPGVGSRGGQLQQSTGAPLCAAVSEVGARERTTDRFLESGERKEGIGKARQISSERGERESERDRERERERERERDYTKISARRRERERERERVREREGTEKERERK